MNVDNYYLFYCTWPSLQTFIVTYTVDSVFNRRSVNKLFIIIIIIIIIIIML